MGHAGVSYGAWKRRVRSAVSDRAPSTVLHLLLDEDELRRDHDAGLSVESAAASRISDAERLR